MKKQNKPQVTIKDGLTEAEIITFYKVESDLSDLLGTMGYANSNTPSMFLEHYVKAIADVAVFLDTYIGEYLDLVEGFDFEDGDNPKQPTMDEATWKTATQFIRQLIFNNTHNSKLEDDIEVFTKGFLVMLNEINAFLMKYFEKVEAHKPTPEVSAAVKRIMAMKK